MTLNKQGRKRWCQWCHSCCRCGVVHPGLTSLWLRVWMACLKTEHLTVLGRRLSTFRQAFRAEDRRTRQPKDAAEVFEAAKDAYQKDVFFEVLHVPIVGGGFKHSLFLPLIDDPIWRAYLLNGLLQTQTSIVVFLVLYTSQVARVAHSLGAFHREPCLRIDEKSSISPI